VATVLTVERHTPYIDHEAHLCSTPFMNLRRRCPTRLNGLNRSSKNQLLNLL
jgi:hypothetical protein